MIRVVCLERAQRSEVARLGKDVQVGILADVEEHKRVVHQADRRQCVQLILVQVEATQLGQALERSRMHVAYVILGE